MKETIKGMKKKMAFAQEVKVKMKLKGTRERGFKEEEEGKKRR